MGKRVIVVWRATRGVACAVAAYCRACRKQPDIIFADEVSDYPWSADSIVILPELLVAYLNRSPIPPLIELARLISVHGAKVVGYSAQYQVRERGDDLFSRILCTHAEEIRGYTPAIVGLRGDVALDACACELLELADRLDLEHSPDAESELLALLPREFSTEPDNYRGYVQALSHAHR